MFFLRFIIFILFGLFSSNVLCQKKTTKTKVIFSITYTDSYCGGAAPSELMLKQLATPKPFSFKKIIIKKGIKNTFENIEFNKFSTDTFGKYTLALAPGKYIIVDELKESKKNYDSIIQKFSVKTSKSGIIDTACYKEFFMSPDYSFIVPQKSKSKYIRISHNYHISCNWSGSPCVPFTGFYPQ